MEKVIFNLFLLLVLASPCLLVFTDSLALQIMGAFYAVTFYYNIIKPVIIKIQNNK